MTWMAASNSNSRYSIQPRVHRRAPKDSMRIITSALSLLLAALAVLGGCATQPRPAASSRGSIVSLETLKHFTRSAIDQDNDNRALSGPAECDVAVVQLTYASIGVRGEPAVLSAGLFVPEHCAGPYPVLAEAHGTEANRRSLTTEVSPGSNVVAFFAAHGYLVVATDYLGLGKSDYPYHPYLHAASEASAVIDSIRAAKQAANTLHVPASSQVMLYGYSQGGHAAMAAQREIELHDRAEFNLVASAPMSGPYNLSQTFLSSWFGRTAGQENTFAPELLAFTLVNYNQIYHNLYTDPRQIFSARYAEAAAHLFPSTRSLGAILKAQVLPPASQINEIRNPAFTADFLVNDHDPFRQDLAKNDLLDWTPTTPMVLCGSHGDAMVDFNNAYAAQAFFRSRGVEVPVIDVAEEIPAKASGTEHHATYGGPLCYAAARSQLFDPIRKGATARENSRMSHSRTTSGA